MKRVLILQARTTSTRLPGKVLMDLGGVPMMRVQIDRLRRCAELDEIVVATTVNAADDPVVRLAGEAGVRWFRGSEADVLSRYAGAAREAGADLVVRSTADCPLIEPTVVDRVVRHLRERPASLDYASNVVHRTWPRGLDVEALFRDTLERVHRMATSAPAREHVTQFILAEEPALFRVGIVTDGDDNADLSWTVDTADDLARVRWLHGELRRAGDESYVAALRIARAHATEGR